MSIEAIRFRASEAGVILQVLERNEGGGRPYYSDSTAVWRDAKVEDLLEVARFTAQPGDWGRSRLLASEPTVL